MQIIQFIQQFIQQSPVFADSRPNTVSLPDSPAAGGSRQPQRIRRSVRSPKGYAHIPTAEGFLPSGQALDCAKPCIAPGFGPHHAAPVQTADFSRLSHDSKTEPYRHCKAPFFT